MDMVRPADIDLGSERRAPLAPVRRRLFLPPGRPGRIAGGLSGRLRPAPGWRGRRRFVVGELGFGTGLNILALLDLWRRTREPGARLNIFSIEAYSVARADAIRALAAWPRAFRPRRPPDRRLADRRGLAPLGFRRPRRRPGPGRRRGAAGPSPPGTGRADALFLDGFSPARNPEMWRDEVLALVARRSAPGARGGHLHRRRRRAARPPGPGVSRSPSGPAFGAKGERLEAALPGPPAAEPAAPRIAIIGAGIAGAALARAFRAEGLAATVVEAHGAGARRLGQSRRPGHPAAGRRRRPRRPSSTPRPSPAP